MFAGLILLTSVGVSHADVVPTRNSFGDELPDAGLYTLPISVSIGR